MLTDVAGAGLAGPRHIGAAPPMSGAAAPAAVWPFVGRAEILARTTERLAGALPAAVLLVGDPGIGKSRLLGEVLATRAQDGDLTFRITAVRGCRELPFAALAPVLPPGVRRERVADDVIRWLRHRARGRRIVLGVDDVNLLDNASTALVALLLAHGTAAVVATARTEAARAAQVAAIARVSALQHTVVPPLGSTDCAELASAALGGPVDALSVAGSWQASLGNPLVLRELLRTAVDREVVRWSHGMWTFSAADLATLRLDELAPTMLGELSPEEVAALRYVAHADPLPLAALERLVPVHVYEALEERGVLVAEPDPHPARIRLAVPALAPTLRLGDGTVRARRLFRDLAAAVPATGRDFRATLWWCAAGLPVDTGTVLAASDAAVHAGQPHLAERLARVVTEPAASWELGRSMLVQGRWAEADAALARASHSHPSPEHRARAAALRAVAATWGGNPGTGAAVLAEARAVLRTDLHGELRPADLAVAAATGRPGTPVESADPLLAAVAGYAYAQCAVAVGRPVDAVTGPTPFPWPAVWAAHRLCEVRSLVQAGRLSDAVARAADGYRTGVSTAGALPDAAAVATLDLARAICARYQGRFAKARRHLAEAATLTGPTVMLPVRAAVAAYAPETASDPVVVAVAAEPRDLAGLEQAWRVAYAGRSATAGAQLRTVATRAAAAGNVAVAAEAWALLARIDPGADTARELRRLAVDSGRVLFARYAEHATAVVDGDLERLESLGAWWNEHGFVPLALEAYTSAANSRHGRAASAAAIRVEQLRRRCDDVWPGWLPRPATAGSLTTRERQIGELAATGLGNADIAGDLQLSVRTVENHLQRCYDKLGINRRVDLPRALGLGSGAAFLRAVGP